MQQRWDFIIIGAGLAGSAAAIILARAGHAVLVLEKEVFPRDKLCGEFLSGESRRLLTDLGCLEEILSNSPPSIEAMDFVSMRGASVRVPLPHPAMGLRRLVLDHVLARQARATGATVLEGLRVGELQQDGTGARVVAHAADGTTLQFKADYVLAAHGRRDKLDRDLGRQWLRQDFPYVGLKRHFVICDNSAGENLKSSLAGRGKMFALRGGYLGLCQVDHGQVNACALVHKLQLEKKDAGADAWETAAPLFSKNRTLQVVLQSLQPVQDERVQVVAQVPFVQKEKALGRVFFLGDAAGMITPLCGDGQAMALQSGIELGHLLTHRRSQAPQVLRQAWEARWSELFQRRMVLGRGLQVALLQSYLSEAAIRTANLLPLRVVQALAAATRGT